MEGTEERIRELEARTIEISQFEQQRENKQEKKRGQSIGDLRDCNKRSNFCVIRVPEGDKKGHGAEKAVEEMRGHNGALKIC